MMAAFGKWACAGFAVLSLAACSGPDKTEQAAQNSGATTAPATNAQGTPAAAQGEVSKNFALSDFTGIELSSADDVRVLQGATFAIRAVGPAADVAQLNLRVEKGQLLISRTGNAAAIKDVDIDVVMPAVNRLTVSGSGEIKADMVNAERAILAVSGSGDLDVNGGKVTMADLQLTGSGSIDVEKMQAESLNITSSGSGDVDAFASRTAAITLKGSGDVEVKGGATCEIKKAGTGKAVCR